MKQLIAIVAVVCQSIAHAIVRYRLAIVATTTPPGDETHVRQSTRRQLRPGEVLLPITI
jgi:hypothetical protein